MVFMIREITIDDNIRTALGVESIAGQYFVFTQPDGEIRLVPALLIPDRELEVYRDPAQIGALVEGLKSLREHGSHRSPEIEAWLDEVNAEEVAAEVG